MFRHIARRMLGVTLSTLGFTAGSVSEGPRALRLGRAERVLRRLLCLRSGERAIPLATVTCRSSEFHAGTIGVLERGLWCWSVGTRSGADGCSGGSQATASREQPSAWVGPAKHSSIEATKGDRNMQAGTVNHTEPGVVIAPDPARSKYDIEIPWLVVGEREQSRALDDVDVSLFKVLFYHPVSADSEEINTSNDGGDRIAESREISVISQGVPREQFVADIVERIGKYIGVVDLDHSVSRIVYNYLSKRCYGRHIGNHDGRAFLDLIRSDSGDYIARYLSEELIDVIFQPTCIKIALSSTAPFNWTYDMHLIESRKTIFRSVASVNKFERNFAGFLDRCEDVICFASLAVADQHSIVLRGEDGSLFSSILPYDPDWIVVHHYHGSLRYWIASTKERPSNEMEKHQFIATEWCERATKTTGNYWQYICIDPDRCFSTYPSFQALIVHHVSRDLAAFRAAQKVSISLEEILQMRDEGRRSWSL